MGEVRSFLGELYRPDLHAERIDALAGATLGVIAAASLAVAMIGQALAQARDLVTKYAVKQVDRLLSSNGIDLCDSFARWVPHQVGSRGNVLVAKDRRDFDHDGQSTLVLSLMIGSRPRRAAAVAESLEREDCDPAQRLRGCLSAPPGRTRPAKSHVSDELSRVRIAQ
jgi:hypothetical protein